MINDETDLFDMDWYALYVRFQSEYKISSLLKSNIGVEALAPSRRVWRKREGKIEVFRKPLLPTYIFIKANLAKVNWRQFYTIPGIIGFVNQSGSPAPLMEEQVLSLNKLVDSENPVHEMEYMRLKPSDLVKITHGPLAGATGCFIRADNETGRFVVTVDLFNRSLVTELDAGYVRAI